MKIGIKSVIAVSFCIMSMSGCKNKEVTADVQRFCSCLAENQTNDLGRIKCIELMEEIKKKYSGDNHALMQVLEETDKCL